MTADTGSRFLAMTRHARHRIVVCRSASPPSQMPTSALRSLASIARFPLRAVALLGIVASCRPATPATTSPASVAAATGPAPDPSRFHATDAAPGPEGQKQIAGAFRAAFPGLRFTVEALIAEDDFVVGRWMATGTHRGRWAAVEPTGKTATLAGVNVFRFEDGKVAEIWNFRDDLGLLEQLGAAVFAGAPT
jgi:predicted ester cyclase